MVKSKLKTFHAWLCGCGRSGIGFEHLRSQTALETEEHEETPIPQHKTWKVSAPFGGANPHSSC